MQKNRISPPILIAYLLVGLLNIIGEALDIQTLINISKPLLMPILAGFILSFGNLRFKKAILIALLASWLGDVFLLLNHIGIGDFFLYGLASFAMTQTIYFVVFAQLRKGQFWKTEFPLIILGLIYGLFLWYMAFKVSISLLVAIAIYGILISLMVYQAWLLSAIRKKYRFILYGAILFYISDLTIALSRLAGVEMEWIKPGVFIMLTYIIAQALIIMGISKSYISPVK